MIETKEIEINGDIYSVTQLPARRALVLQAKLVKMLGASAAQMFVASGLDDDKAGEAIPKALSLLMEQIDDKTFDKFVLDILVGVRKNGTELNPALFDMEFAGKLNTVFLLMKFVLEVNFSDFFQEGGIIEALFPTKKAPISPELKKA